MLRQGSSGDEVKDLQRSLRLAGQDTGPLDGIFGPKTDAAVRAFQEAAGLSVDGIAGPNTVAALEEAVAAAKEAERDRGFGYKAPEEKDYRPGGAE